MLELCCPATRCVMLCCWHQPQKTGIVCYGRRPKDPTWASFWVISPPTHSSVAYAPLPPAHVDHTDAQQTVRGPATHTGRVVSMHPKAEWACHYSSLERRTPTRDLLHASHHILLSGHNHLICRPCMTAQGRSGPPSTVLRPRRLRAGKAWACAPAPSSFRSSTWRALLTRLMVFTPCTARRGGGQGGGSSSSGALGAGRLHASMRATQSVPTHIVLCQLDDHAPKHRGRGIAHQVFALGHLPRQHRQAGSLTKQEKGKATEQAGHAQAATP